MPRYSDVDKLDDVVQRLNDEGWEITRYEYKRIESVLFEFPPADVVERKKGKWKETEAFPHWLYCDQCYKRIVPNSEWIKEYNIPTNFCPNCGADMRKETDYAVH